MREYLFFKTIPQVLLIWCLRPPASSTCATSSVLWLCATPISHHLKKSMKKLYVHLVCVPGKTIAMRVGRSNVKALLHMCHVIYHWYNSSVILRNDFGEQKHKAIEISAAGMELPRL